MKLRLNVVLMGAALLSLGGMAQATVVTFDDIPNTANAIQTTASSSGYDFNGLHFHIVDSADARLVRNASTSYLAAEAAQGLGQPVTMTKAGGGTFSLNGMDVAELWLSGDANNSFFEVLISASVFGGGTLSKTVVLDGIRDGAGGVDDFQGVIFSGWDNLTSVTITGRNAAGGFGDYSIDNIQIDSSTVPEPATLALLGLGLAGICFGRRKSA